MRKLLILVMAVSLFAACKNDKGKVSRDDRRSDRYRDDYRDRNEDAKDKDTKNTDYSDDKDNRNTDDSNTDDYNNRDNGGWSSGDENIFVDNCVSTAVDGGMQKGKATDYCECMQRKLEVMYPNSKDVGNIDTETTDMKEMIRKCLGM